MLNMNEVIANVTLTKVCSIKADKDSDISKQITLRVKFDGTQLQAVFDKAVSGAVIAWQNGVGRKGFDTFKPGQVIDIQFNAPASRTAIDPETAMIAKLSNMTEDEQEKYIRDMIAKTAHLSTKDMVAKASIINKFDNMPKDDQDKYIKGLKA